MIGIFDSGLGGLTVVKQIFRYLPDRQIIYLGDTARLPYGTKSPKLIRKFSVENSEFLLQKKAKIIVVACHTASVLAGESLRSYFKDVPIFDVAKTTKEIIKSLPQHSRIGIIGTPATIKSGIYQTGSRNINKKSIFTQSCPLLVPLTEEGWIKNKETESITRHYLKNLQAKKIDTLILACTHYPLLTSVFKKILGPEVQIIDPAQTLAQELKQFLDKKSASQKSKNGKSHQFFITDESYNWKHLGKMILNKNIQINIINGNDPNRT